MSAQEFGEWITYFEREQLHPAAQRLRHAQLLAAVSNGAMTRRDGAHWAASHFLPPDPWAPPEPEPEQPSPQQLAEQVAALNARMD